MLEKVVHQDNLSTLVVNLYPRNEGYSLMLKDKTGAGKPFSLILKKSSCFIAQDISLKSWLKALGLYQYNIVRDFGGAYKLGGRGAVIQGAYKWLYTCRWAFDWWGGRLITRTFVLFTCIWTYKYRGL